jgi:hypothetical protein
VLRWSGVEVNDLRKRPAVAGSEGGGVEVDSLRKRTATACSRGGIEDAWWQWWRDGF